jgi:hypothetical protein
MQRSPFFGCIGVTLGPAIGFCGVVNDQLQRCSLKK